jgi:hypothetical protein
MESGLQLLHGPPDGRRASIFRCKRGRPVIEEGRVLTIRIGLIRETMAGAMP